MPTYAPVHTQRATQGFVGTLTWAWRRPSLTLIEIAWRWVFGIPALLLVYREMTHVLAAVPWQGTGVQSLTVNQLLTDPLRASVSLAEFSASVWPGILRAAVWLAPLLLLDWAIVSAYGRGVLLRRMDGRLHGRFRDLLVLQVLRLLPMLLLAGVWWFGLQSLARVAILTPIETGGEPQMMAYVGGVIVLSLGLFLLASGIGWIFSAAPLIAMLHGTGPLASIRRAAQLRHVRGSMLEINLVLSVVKIMLLVLAMAFSAFPLPFASVITPEYVAFWSALVGVWYLAASDFFHVTRLAGYLHLLPRQEVTESATTASEYVKPQPR